LAVSKKPVQISLSINYCFQPAELSQTFNNDLGPKTEIFPDGGDFLEIQERILSWLGPDPESGQTVFRISLGAAESFFYPPDPSNYWHRQRSEANVTAWKNSSLDWINDTFGQLNWLAAYNPGTVIPEDLTLPHLLLWLPERVWLKSPAALWKAPQVKLLESYGQGLKNLGLALEPLPKRPASAEIARYYHIVKNPAQTKPPSFNRTGEKIVWPPVPPLSGRLSGEVFLKYAGECTEALLSGCGDYLEELDFMGRAGQLELERLKFQSFKITKIINSFSRKIRELEALGEPILGLWPPEVLSVFYQAELIQNGDINSYQNVNSYTLISTYRLQDGRILEINGFKWTDPAASVSGQGAFSLLSHLADLDTDGVILKLLSAFTVEEVTRTLAFHTAVCAGETGLQEIMARPFVLPNISEASWPKIRHYFLTEFRFPEAVVDRAHAEGRLLSTPRGMIVFSCENTSGMFFMFRQKFTGTSVYCEQPLADSLPWLLPGNGSSGFLTDHPAEALALKSIFPDSPAAAAGWKTSPEKIRACFGKQTDIILAVRPEHGGNILSRRFSFLKGKKLKVPAGQTWAEYWLMRQEASSRRGLNSAGQR
jgi:hypothetical protein